MYYFSLLLLHESLSMQCIVHGCRYASRHDTLDHKCGSCGKFGHGRVECRNESELHTLNMLYEKYKEILPTVQHSIRDSIGKIYTIVAIDGGNAVYAKRDNVHSKFSFFFMHGDSWGQYDSGINDLPKLLLFLDGYSCV